MFKVGRMYLACSGNRMVPTMCLWRIGDTAAFYIDSKDGAFAGIAGRFVRKIVRFDQTGDDGAPRECVPMLGDKPPADGWYISDVERKEGRR